MLRGLWANQRRNQEAADAVVAAMRQAEAAGSRVLTFDRHYKWKRAYFEHGGFGLPAMGVGRAPLAGGEAASAEADRAADGSAFIFSTLHRRMRLEALADAMGLDLPPRALAGQAAEPEAARLYD